MSPTMRRRKRFAAILTASVVGNRAEARALAGGSQLDGLVELAVEHGVAGAVYEALRDCADVDPAVVRGLAAVVLDNRLNQRRIEDDLGDLAAILRPCGLTWLVVKGPAVAATLYPLPELRSWGDIDVLVSPAQFPLAVTALEQSGHDVDDANWKLIRRLEAGQLHFWLSGGSALDLHWHLHFNAGRRSQFGMPTEELLARRRVIEVGGTPIFTLDPVDTLVHLCYHAALGGGDRLTWLDDINRAARVPELSWELVVERSRAWHMELPVGTMLLRCSRRLRTPVPDSVIHGLLPDWWRIGAGALDRAFPVAPAYRHTGNLASLLARSSAVSNTPIAALGSVVAGLMVRIRALLRTGSSLRIDRGDPGEELRTPAGDLHDRAMYFDALARHANPSYPVAD